MAGRPTKYCQEAQEQADAYVRRCQGAKETPYVEELALLLEVNDDTLSEWGREHEEFSATIKRLKLLQRLSLKRGALEKRLHANMAIFLLKTNHPEEAKAEPIDVKIRFVDALTAADAIEEVERKRLEQVRNC